MIVRRLVTVAALVAAWCALWGEVTAANVLSGAVVAVLVTSGSLGTAVGGGIRLRPLARFAALVAADLVVSTVTVAKEIITPSDRTDETIIAVDLPEARSHLLLLIVSITVTPGTAVVDADTERGILYLHLLHRDRRANVERHVRELADLACAALPTDERRSASATASEGARP